MRSFLDVDALLARVPSEVVGSLRHIDRGAGSELWYAHQVPSLLQELAHRARVESVKASSAIEGVVVPDAHRAARIIEGRSMTLRTRSEQQLAGYRKALDYLFTESWQPLNIGLVLHLHRLLWSETDAAGGTLKTDDNLVVDRSSDGTLQVRFTPVSAVQTSFYLSELIDRFVGANATARHHPVLLVGVFVLDLLIIHPFDDGNGRVARVIANALLADAGYGVGRWVSLEQLIAERPEEYYSALLSSTVSWHEDRSDPWPWLTFFASTVESAYRLFAARVTSMGTTVVPKQQQVRDYVLTAAPAVFAVADIRRALPGVSDPTIRLVLAALRREGRAQSEGTGRSAVWRRLDGPRAD